MSLSHNTGRVGGQVSLSHNAGRVGGQMCLFLITQGEWVDRCVSFS